MGDITDTLYEATRDWIRAVFGDRACLEFVQSVDETNTGWYLIGDPGDVITRMAKL